jgi:hypothetical protein
MTFRTYDQATVDSLGAFLVGQLEQLDRTIHEPLQDFKWSRDLVTRTDVTMGHDFSSFTNMAMASVGGINPLKKAFIGKDSTTLPNVAIDIGKTASPLIPWGLELNYSFFELESAQLLGQGIDEQKHFAIKRKFQQDADIQAYLGDTDIPNAYGLLNSPQVPTTGNVENGGSGSSTLWTTKTADQILGDVNTLINAVWAATGYTKCPKKLGLPPAELAYIVSQKVSSAGNISILQFLRDNCISLQENGTPLEIVAMKWLTGTNNGNALGPAATDSMIVYTQEYELVRFPMVPMIGLPNQFKGASQIRPYVAKLGLVEFVYPETVGYAQGIG